MTRGLTAGGVVQWPMNSLAAHSSSQSGKDSNNLSNKNPDCIGCSFSFKKLV